MDTGALIENTGDRGHIHVDDDISEKWLAWQLVVQGWVTIDGLENMSIDDCEEAGRVLEIWKKINSR